MKQSTKYLKILVNLLVAVLGIVFLCFIFPRMITFFMPFVIGWLISMIANPLVRFLEKRLKIVRKHGSMMIIIAVLAAVILLGYLGISKLVVETGNLIENLPQIYENWQEDFEEIGQNLEIVYNRVFLHGRAAGNPARLKAVYAWRGLGTGDCGHRRFKARGGRLFQSTV